MKIHPNDAMPDAIVTARRHFMKTAAGATAGLAVAGMLEPARAEVGSSRATGTASSRQAGFVLPKATSAIAPFRVEIPETDIADPKRHARSLSARWRHHLSMAARNMK